MTITPKFELGDVVFFLKDSDVKKAPIIKICAETVCRRDASNPTVPVVRIDIDYTCGTWDNNVIRSESQVALTLQDLILTLSPLQSP
jgi:hypothetical protein